MGCGVLPVPVQVKPPPCTTALLTRDDGGPGHISAWRFRVGHCSSGVRYSVPLMAVAEEVVGVVAAAAAEVAVMAAVGVTMVNLYALPSVAFTFL